MSYKRWDENERELGAYLYSVGGIPAVTRATGRSRKSVEQAAWRFGWRKDGANKPWTTRDVAKVKDGACLMSLAAELGRSPQAVKCKARSIGVKLAPASKANEWPKETISRAMRMREYGYSVLKISESTGAPYGTVRHWVYGF
jgi:hypothetical protein